MAPQTLYDKLWDSHLVHERDDGYALLYIDRHFVIEVTSAQTYEGLRLAGRKPWRPGSIVATADHNTPTRDWDQGITDPVSQLQVDTLDANVKAYGAAQYYPFRDRHQGIAHVIGPELGATLPGMTIGCGDSHTTTHGALGTLAFGIGTSEVESVLATQCLVMKKWGTSPELVVAVNGAIPDPAADPDPVRRDWMERALRYMGLEPHTPITSIAIDKVFIGSCTNSRIEDLRAAAAVVRGRKVAARVKQALVVPGSGSVKRQAEEEGLDRIFVAAGFEWRQPGCSMCVGINEDRLNAGERCASTSNRNFEGRQGPGGRTHLVSPETAAAAAIAGRFVDVREMLFGSCLEADAG